MRLIDTHCHLDAPEFDADRDVVVARAEAAGVRAQVVPAIALSNFQAIRALCAAHAGLYAAYGLHPMFVAEHRPEHLDALRAWIERERPVAVGECGLDFFVEGLDAQAQRWHFVRQLELAREFELPVIVHARRAVDEVIATIRRVGGLRGVVHSWSGSEEQARQLWKLGFLLGLGGPVTHERARRLRRLAASMPLEFLLLETDSPDQPLADHRGERNEPARLREVLDTIAALRGESADAVARATTANAERLFGLPSTAA
ncbi:TatD family hydrolase [Dokdonella ginsengisoli]|uniref:TatD family hydrolase n=1 Tax=Dokdonella ginsengisoli TaxID=363846 RepID=A0ABV9QTW7_9GAMM